MGAAMMRWTPAADAELARLYRCHSVTEIAAAMGRTRAAVKNRIHTLGLQKPAGYINTGRFTAGQTSWNSGRSYNAGGRSAETRFKPGTRQGRAAAIYRPLGSERISKDGYLERKINEGRQFHRRWRAVHLILWESAHGPLPAGHALVFKDGDRSHIALDNLELITRAELMGRNTVHNLPKELADLVQLRGALLRKINHAERTYSQGAST